MMGLTPPQHACLDAIEVHHARLGTMPTLEELRAELGLPSKSGVARILDQLEERGAIKRMRRRARAIHIVRKTCPHCGLDVRSRRNARAP